MRNQRILLAFIILAGCMDTHHDVSEDKNWQLSGFIKADSINPILEPDSNQTFDCPLTGNTVMWEERNVLNPAAVVRGDSVYLFYRAQDKTGTSRIGMAISNDGLHFKKYPSPVLYPDNDRMLEREWNYQKKEGVIEGKDYFDGAEDPRIVMTGEDQYIMTYTAYDGKVARLALATSTDLVHWDKKGLVFNDEKYRDDWSKSGAIVARMENGKAIATRVGGEYWMYYGDTDLFMASSTDLLKWKVAEDGENQARIAVLHPRKGYFDSRLVEPGPFAMLKDDGILLIYNASNARNFNDPEIPEFTYAAGQALFDKERPYKLIARTDTHFIYPDKPYEKVGEVNEVCFVEGMVYFRGRWFLYYGTADSRIAVAVRE